MPVTPEQLFAFLDSLSIAHQTVAHPPFFTVEDGKDWCGKIPGLDCKNLFLKDKKGDLWLVVMPSEKRADLAGLAQKTGAVKFSFGKPDLLLEKLGVTPGSVTPFALMNDAQKHVHVVLDADMMQADMVNYHPLHNAASTAISSADLMKFLRALDRHPVIIDCGTG
ncbi:MAG: prolyl-tRNA synthetase associated domain-containing protein [Alphaproteobacteria bacterium]|nr:prolyl-tRNA synthetase associated domain-containing protein [Alphaproteobacteria bacterium]